MTKVSVGAIADVEMTLKVGQAHGIALVSGSLQT